MSVAYTENVENLVQQLSSENRTYFKDLRGYMESKSVFISEEKTEILLYDILQDLLIAQDHGETAEEYLGNNPREMADELLQRIPKATLKEHLKFIAPFTAYVVVVMMLFEFMQKPVLQINLFHWLFLVTLVLCGYLLLMKASHRYIYDKASIEKLHGFKIFIPVFFITILLMFSHDFIVSHTPTVTIPFPYDCIVAAFLFACYLLYFALQRKGRFLLLAIIGLFVFGLTLRIPGVPPFWLGNLGWFIRMGCVSLLLYVGFKRDKQS